MEWVSTLTDKSALSEAALKNTDAQALLLAEASPMQSTGLAAGR